MVYCIYDLFIISRCNLLKLCVLSYLATYPFFRWQYVNMAYASGVMAVAVTQTGEAGYSLYIPSDHALHLYDRIMTVRKYSLFAFLS